MTIHHLAPARATLLGQFAADLPPALTIASGDSIHSALNLALGVAQGLQRPQRFARPDHGPAPSAHLR